MQEAKLYDVEYVEGMERRLRDLTIKIANAFKRDQQQDETAWLAEHQNNGPCWWGRTPDGEDAFGWTKDPLAALRFARKEDAEAYIEETGWNDVSAVEHIWCAPRAVSQQPQN